METVKNDRQSAECRNAHLSKLQQQHTQLLQEIEAIQQQNSPKCFLF